MPFIWWASLILKMTFKITNINLWPLHKMTISRPLVITSNSPHPSASGNLYAKHTSWNNIEVAHQSHVLLRDWVDCLSVPPVAYHLLCFIYLYSTPSHIACTIHSLTIMCLTRHYKYLAYICLIGVIGKYLFMTKGEKMISFLISWHYLIYM